MGALWDALTGGLGSILAFFYSILPDAIGSARYGIAIIMLTLAVNLLMFPLTLKQTRSMKAMQEIQPEVKKLQKEYKDDRQLLNQKLMELYQERGVNPAAGCLPLIAQMPIWFALFTVLRTSQEALRDGTGPIPESDLSRALVEGKSNFLAMDLQIEPSEATSDGFVSLIPYLILILVVVGTGYYQSRQTMRRRNGDAVQTPQQESMQKVMKFMPILFGVFSWNFPTGLVLYFATSNLFRIGQQAYILRLDDAGSAKPSIITREVVEEPKPVSSKPSPHASKKKRNRRRRK